MAKQELTSDWWSINDLEQLLSNNSTFVLSGDQRNKVDACRQYLTQEIGESNRPVYGINTGFGALCNTSIPNDSLEELQYNLVRSHACGMGDVVPDEVARLMLLLKAKGLSYGHSGVSCATIDRLLHLYNAGVVPKIYTQGSLGASGDLSPLAHLALTLIGEGEVKVNGVWMETAEYYRQENLQPIKLQSKEGLALLNGTQFMSAYASWLVIKANRLSLWADVIGCLSLEGYDGRLDPFTPQVHAVRAHQGQVDTAARILQILEGSELASRDKKHVQDPYSFRCMPQVHGASKDAIRYVTGVVEREINSVTDNPTIFPEEDLIVSAGNFHGQPLALALDFLAIALAELASISERRTYKLTSGQRGLPAFLVADPGLNSGFMIPQYTAASIVSQNKQLCTPASVDTIDSSNGQEDHVSMGANAATKTYQVTRNVEQVLAIELLNAAQAVEFQRPGSTSQPLETLLKAFRAKIPFMKQDRWLHKDMVASQHFLQSYLIHDLF